MVYRLQLALRVVYEDRRHQTFNLNQVQLSSIKWAVQPLPIKINLLNRQVFLPHISQLQRRKISENQKLANEKMWRQMSLDKPFCLDRQSLQPVARLSTINQWVIWIAKERNRFRKFSLENHWNKRVVKLICEHRRANKQESVQLMHKPARVKSYNQLIQNWAPLVLARAILGLIDNRKVLA